MVGTVKWGKRGDLVLGCFKIPPGHLMFPPHEEKEGEMGGGREKRDKAMDARQVA